MFKAAEKAIPLGKKRALTLKNTLLFYFFFPGELFLSRELRA